MQHRIQRAQPCARRGIRPDEPRGYRDNDERTADEAPTENAREIGGGSESSGGFGRGVWIVEDETLTAVVIEKVVRTVGYNVVGPAGRMADAVAMVRPHHFDASA